MAGLPDTMLAAYLTELGGPERIRICHLAQPPPQPHLSWRQATRHLRKQRCWAIHLVGDVDDDLAAAFGRLERLVT